MESLLSKPSKSEKTKRVRKEWKKLERKKRGRGVFKRARWGKVESKRDPLGLAGEWQRHALLSRFEDAMSTSIHYGGSH